jgi:hypothetical protein
MYTYEYTGDEPMNLPTLGIHVEKGNIVESVVPLNSPYLKETTDKTEIEAEIKTEQEKLAELEAEEKGVGQ